MRTFTLQNVSGKEMLAWVLSFDDESGTSQNRWEDRTDETTGLQPAARFQLMIGLEEASRFKARGITVSAVVFADGTTYGSQRQIESLRVHRLGRSLEIERIRLALDPEQRKAAPDLEIVRKMVGSIPATPDEAFRAVRDVNLPEVVAADVAAIKDDGLRLSFAAGVRNARTDVITRLDQLQSRRTRSGAIAASALRHDIVALWGDVNSAAAKNRVSLERWRRAR